MNPGCYLMKDVKGQVIYVGKAKRLKNRVKSYFTGSHNGKTARLVREIVDFEYIITSSELEALVLEINLIKKYDPKYNIMLTDDKHYPYIKITNETHPRLVTTRKIKKDGGKYFQKVLETTNFGIKLEKSYATTDSLVYKLTIDEGTDITNARIS